MHLHRPLSAPAFALVLGCVGVPAALAQTDPPPGVANSRAARDADNPMRMIIEASKLKVRIKPDGPEAAPAERRAAPRPKPEVAPAIAPAAAPVAKRAASAPVAAVAAAASQAVPAVVAATPASAPASVPAPVTNVAATAPPAQVVAKAAEQVPPVVAAPRATVQSLPPQPLKLVQMVEPSLPSSVLRRIRSDLEVVVGFTVNADGSVADVVVRSNPMKAIDSSIVEAVSQWRYQPIREARTHAVQLVLRASP